MLGIGLNYIRFAIEEPHLFHFLFKSDYFGGRTLLEQTPKSSPRFFRLCRELWGLVWNRRKRSF